MALSVIGVGLGRTGTLSLKVALEMLGFRRCYHMVEGANPPCMSDWIAAADGRADWDKLFAGYQATVDYPGCQFWRELTAAYPQAKAVLSVRDPQSWFESTQTTIFSPRMRERVGVSPARDFLDKTVWNTFGNNIHDRGYMVAAFERHTEEVQRSIPRDRLLTFDVTQGWQPLCEFLDVPVPRKPFTRLNSREELSMRVEAARAEGAEQDKVANAKAYVAGLRKLSE